MTLFWIAAALMLLLGYLMFVPALLGKTGSTSISRARLNLELHRQRQQELAADAASPAALNSTVRAETPSFFATSASTGIFFSRFRV